LLNIIRHLKEEESNLLKLALQGRVLASDKQAEGIEEGDGESHWAWNENLIDTIRLTEQDAL
jgi:hypothetical protein